ncbi:hypothetical protein HZC53_04875 [Candidatus Uhrbacteria bacterium]|nr:hypothetical protein [Candidatus Uhrbacteria bacterium]
MMHHMYVVCVVLGRSTFEIQHYVSEDGENYVIPFKEMDDPEGGQEWTMPGDHRRVIRDENVSSVDGLWQGRVGTWFRFVSWYEFWHADKTVAEAIAASFRLGSEFALGDRRGDCCDYDTDDDHAECGDCCDIDDDRYNS